MTEDGFVWEDPPSPKTGQQGGRWARVAEQLAERPGEWALVATISYRNAGGATNRLKKRGCEATSRANSDGTSAIYARWPEETT